ncbi:MAG: hypothetical protein ABI183_19365 [Polyangiaceae bacterium]
MVNKTLSLLLLAAACTKTSPPSEHTPDATASSVADAPLVSIDAGIATDAGNVVGSETYLGAIGGLPIHATLSVSDRAISGRWFYEKGGAAEGLAIEAHAAATTKNHFVGTEMIADGGVSGDLSLERSGVELTGSWSKHTAGKTLPILLTPEIRSKSGDHVIRAKRVMIKNDGLNATTNPGFLPVIEGPEAARITPSLTFKALLGDDESELVGGTITALDFDVLMDDNRLITLAITEETMGAYPSSNVLTDTFDLQTGKKIGADALKVDQKVALAHLLDKRVHDAWKSKKQELAKAPVKEGECGPDVANGFMDGSGPSFTVALLDGVAATKNGLTFDFDFGFPHVVLACSPAVDLSLTWKEASAFIDPKGPFGGR